MSQRALFILRSNYWREVAIKIIREVAPAGSRVEIKGPKRTLPQNDRFWGMLTDFSRQLAWTRVDGTQVKITTRQWKKFFVSQIRKELRREWFVNIDGNGMIDLSEDSSSSDLSVGEMVDCMTLMEAFGAQHGVKFFFDEDLHEDEPYGVDDDYADRVEWKARVA